jgi:hypothetical protein
VRGECCGGGFTGKAIFGSYYSKTYQLLQHENDWRSKALSDWKAGLENDGTARLEAEVKAVLFEIATSRPDVVIAAVPPHNAFGRGLLGEKMEELGLEQPLVRVYDVARKRGSFERDLYIERASLRAREALVCSKEVLLLDDVCTTGFSLNAGRDILLAAGARSVELRALLEADLGYIGELANKKEAAIGVATVQRARTSERLANDAREANAAARNAGNIGRYAKERALR